MLENTADEFSTLAPPRYPTIPHGFPFVVVVVADDSRDCLCQQDLASSGRGAANSSKRNASIILESGLILECNIIILLINKPTTMSTTVASKQAE